MSVERNSGLEKDKIMTAMLPQTFNLPSSKGLPVRVENHNKIMVVDQNGERSLEWPEVAADNGYKNTSEKETTPYGVEVFVYR